MLPNKYFESGLRLIYDVNKQMGGFIQARLLEAFIVAIIVFIVLFIANIKYAIFLALFAGILNLIPYVGPFIGIIPGLAVAYYYYGIDYHLFITLFAYIFAQAIDIVFIIPMVFSKMINIHPMLVVLLVIIGHDVMGITGMILSVPAFSIIKSILNTVQRRLNVH